MAAQVFPNTVFVQGFPGCLSRRDFLVIFGGSKGYINSIEFVNNHGEPKIAFIEYKEARSLPLVLRMNGAHLRDHSQPLNVQVVDEHILCKHIPGQGRDVEEALANLQKVLSLNLTLVDGLRKSHGQYKLQKRGEEQERNYKLFLANAQIKTTTERCAMLEAENRGLEQRVKEAVELGRESCSNLKMASLRCTQLQAEIDDPRTRSTQVESEPKVEQGRDDLESKQEEEGKAEDMRRALEETTAQKERAMEDLGTANNIILHLQEELKAAQKAAEVSQSSLHWAKSALGDMDSRVSAINAYVTQTPNKRQKAEEDLVDERAPKRRHIEEHQAGETCGTRAYEAEKYETERRQLEERLRLETQQRKEAEASLAEANAKLDQVVLTESMTPVFVRFDQLLTQAADEMSLSNYPSTTH